jgi:DNA-directed RNA polymerase subunit RPC12/RpoP
LRQTFPNIRRNVFAEAKRSGETNMKAIPSSFDWPLCPLPSSPDHSVDYICGNCRAVLLHAEDSPMHNLLILCTECGAHSSTDAYLATVNG